MKMNLSSLLRAVLVSTFALLSMPSFAQSVIEVSFSEDEELMAVGRQTRDTKIYDAKTGVNLSIVKGLRSVAGIAFDASGQELFISDRNQNEMIVVEPRSAKRIGVFSGETGGITRLQRSPNGKFLASSSYDGKVRVWSIAGRKLKGSGRSDRLGGTYDVTISRDNREIFAGGSDGYLNAFSSKSGARLRTSETKRSTIYGLRAQNKEMPLIVSAPYGASVDPVTFVTKKVSDIEGYVIDARGDLYAACANGDVVVASLPSYTVLRTLKQRYGCRAVKISPQGNLIAVGDATGAVHVYSTDGFGRIYSVR